jgi:hypothetical protein
MPPGACRGRLGVAGIEIGANMLLENIRLGQRIVKASATRLHLLKKLRRAHPSTPPFSPARMFLRFVLDK